MRDAVSMEVYALHKTEKSGVITETTRGSDGDRKFEILYCISSVLIKLIGPSQERYCCTFSSRSLTFADLISLGAQEYS